MCPVFAVRRIGRRCGAALPDAWESADRRRRERHFLCGGAGGGFAGLLTAKGEPVSVGSEPCFPLERAYACPAGRVRGHGAKRCLPCGGAGGELAGSPTAKDCRCRWAVSRASPWSVRMCVRQAGGGRLRRETALPMLRGWRRVRVSGRVQTAPGFFAALSSAQRHKNSACRVGTDAVRFQVMPRGLPGAGGPY